MKRESRIEKWKEPRGLVKHIESDISLGMVASYPANTIIALQRLHSLAFGFGTFACAEDQASLPHDGLLRITRHHKQEIVRHLEYVKLNT